MYSFALALLLTAGPTPTSILLVPQSEASRPICEELEEVFTGEGLNVKLAGPKAVALACLKGPSKELVSCLAQAGVKSKVDGIVLINGAHHGASIALTMDLISRGATDARRETTRVLRSKLKAQATPEVQRTAAAAKALAAKQREASEPPPVEPTPVVTAPPPRPEDTPRAVTLEPSPPTVVAPIVAPAPTAPPRGAAIAVTGVAVAATAVAVTFAVLGFSAKNRLDQTPQGISTSSYSGAQQLQSQANSDLTVALGAGIGAAVGAGVASVLWSRP
jgi:hypothetical protein